MRLVLVLCLIWPPVVGCSPGLRIRKIDTVPPPPEPWEAKLVILNEGAVDAYAELTHRDSGRFALATSVAPGQPFVVTVPPGEYSVAERYPFAAVRGTTRRGDKDLDGGQCYEWIVGEKGKGQ